MQYQYNSSIYPSSISYTSGGTTKAFFNYTRNNAGWPIQRVTERDLINYGYSNAAYLTNVNRSFNESRGPASISTFTAETFSYDSLGNRTQDNQTGYNFDNKSTRMISDQFYTYQYDANGNLSTKLNNVTNEIVKHTHNTENQLIKVENFPTALSTSPTKISEYTYDAVGRRMRKIVTDNLDTSKSFTRQYGYNDKDINIIFSNTGQVLARYTHGKTRIDDPVSVFVTTEGVTNGIAPNVGSFSFFKDDQGSITHIADTNGNVLQKIDYSGFGQIIRVSDISDNDITANPLFELHYAFTGREYDRETNLYYYRARYYDAKTGRFIQEDPKAGKIETPISVTNKYVYAANNPLIFTDPNGEAIFTTALIVSALLSAAINAGIAGNAGASGSQVLGAAAVGLVTGALAPGVSQWATGIFGSAVAGAIFTSTALGAVNGAGYAAFVNKDDIGKGALLGAAGGFVGSAGSIAAGGILGLAPITNAFTRTYIYTPLGIISGASSINSGIEPPQDIRATIDNRGRLPTE